MHATKANLPNFSVRYNTRHNVCLNTFKNEIVLARVYRTIIGIHKLHKNNIYNNLRELYMSYTRIYVSRSPCVN